MKRRESLATLGVMVVSLLVSPAKAYAMGGHLPELGETAPDFELPALVPASETAAGVAVATGPEFTTTRLGLKDFSSRWLVLYFYPKDFTSGCTIEARGFQRDLQAFQRRGAEVVGVSADDVDAHASFCGSEGLVFPLLSDPGGTVSQRYGSWIAPFSQRHTFLIDPQGILRARWTAVRPSGHSKEVLEELDRQRSHPNGAGY